jgi:hypothetical protein
VLGRPDRTAGPTPNAAFIKVTGDDTGAHHEVTVAGDGGGDPVDVRRLAFGDLSQGLTVETAEAEDRGPGLVQAWQSSRRPVDRA